LKIINNRAGKRLDPETVKALVAVYERGEIRIQRSISIKRPVAADPAANVPPAASAPPAAEVTNLERTRV
jgi:hypothetical protein